MSRSDQIDIARRLIATGISKDLVEVLEQQFPELSESEDERIRKHLLTHFKNKTKETWCNMPVKNIIAYLEKQKESLHIPETCKENADSFTDENERIRKGLIEYLESDRDYQPCQDVSFYDDAIAYLERQKCKDSLHIEETCKENADSFTDEDERFRKYILKCCEQTIKADVLGLEISMDTTKKLKAFLEKWKDASKAIEAVEKIDKYIDEQVVNADDMQDSNPDKVYYRGWNGALSIIARILQDVYSGEKQKEQPKEIDGEQFKSLMLQYLQDASNRKNDDEIMSDTDMYYEKFMALTGRKQKEQKPHYSPLCNTIKDKIREYIANHFITDTVVKTDVRSIVKAMEEGVRLGKEEQKPAEWSEDDERILKGIIGKIDHDQTYGVSKAEMLLFLKSLRPQPHWKPSEE